jgi:chromosome partitioning protein
MRLLIASARPETGKTTTAANLGAALVLAGARAMLVEPEGNHGLSSHLQRLCPQDSDGSGTAGWPVAGYPGLDLCATPLPLGGAMGARDPDLWTLIDAPAGWSAAMAETARQCDMVLVPVLPDATHLDGLGRFLPTVEAAVQETGGCLRLLISRHANRDRMQRVFLGELIQRFGSDRVLPTMIRASARLHQAGATGWTIFDEAPHSTGAADFAQLARGLLSGRAALRQNKG